MGIDEDRKQQTDFDDLNNEIASRDVGRQARFLGDAIAAEGETKREKEEREYRSLLDQMLQDAEYRRLYDDAWDGVNNAQAAMDQAILENERAKDRLETLVGELEGKAAELENGEKVFRAADGNLYTASGRRLTNEEAHGVEIPDDAPSYEQYTQAKDALERARQRGHDLSEMQTNRIDHARGRLQDEDNPPSKDELREIDRDMRQVTADIRQSSTQSFEAAASAAPPQQVEPPVELAALDQIPTLR